jgi:hypothetical protein
MVNWLPWSVLKISGLPNRRRMIVGLPRSSLQGIDAEVGVQRVRNSPSQRAPDRIAKLPFEPFVVFDRPLPRGGVTVTRRRR